VAALPHFQRCEYESDFCLADEGYRNGRVAATTQTRDKYWREWKAYVKPLGVDPYLQKATTTHATKCRMLSGFAARVRTGKYGRGRKVAAASVSSALTAVGQTIIVDTGVNPTKVEGANKLLYPLQVTMDGWKKEDPPTRKKLPVEVDLPEHITTIGLRKGASQLAQAVGDLVLIAFYFLLRVGEYTTKGKADKKTKQTDQFKMGDVTFFKKDKRGRLLKLPNNATDEDILTANGVTLHLGNQKNGWKNVCLHHHANGDADLCPAKAVGRLYIRIRKGGGKSATYLSSYYTEDGRKDVTNQNISDALKTAARSLDYELLKGISPDDVDSHSLRGGGAQSLFLNGYSDTQIQKMGRWRGETFKEYIREQLNSFSEGMSRSMKKCFNFVNVDNGVWTDITEATILQSYSVNKSAAAA
jgi:hypothetical protein